MSMEDKAVIDMANSAGERREKAKQDREAERNWERFMRKMHRRQLLMGIIPALMCILAATAVLAAVASGSIDPEQVKWATALTLVTGIAGGMCLAEALRW